MGASVRSLMEMGHVKALNIFFEFLGKTDPDSYWYSASFLSGITGVDLKIPHEATNEQAKKIAEQWLAWWKVNRKAVESGELKLPIKKPKAVWPNPMQV